MWREGSYFFGERSVNAAFGKSRGSRQASLNFGKTLGRIGALPAVQRARRRTARLRPRITMLPAAWIGARAKRASQIESSRQANHDIRLAKMRALLQRIAQLQRAPVGNGFCRGGVIKVSFRVGRLRQNDLPQRRQIRAVRPPNFAP